jgi:hypothetical protein
MCQGINLKLTTKLSIRYVLAFSDIVFLQGVLCIFSPSCTCIYLGHWPSDEYKCYLQYGIQSHKLGLGFSFSLPPIFFSCTSSRGQSFFLGLFITVLLNYRVWPFYGPRLRPRWDPLPLGVAGLRLRRNPLRH